MSSEARNPNQSVRLANVFHRLGWCGVWFQVIVGAVPVLLMVYFYIFAPSASGTRAEMPIIAYLGIANVLLLLFTTFWSFRYTLVAKRIVSPEKRPTDKALSRIVWTGISASVISISFSMVVMFVEVAQMLFYFLSAPQAGVPVIQTTGGGSASWVSAADMVNLMVLIITLFAELIVLGFSLWLLMRTIQSSRDANEALAK
ncbi:MAG: DUF3611 family protein [Planctomycetota bacterium]